MIWVLRKFIDVMSKISFYEIKTLRSLHYQNKYISLGYKGLQTSNNNYLEVYWDIYQNQLSGEKRPQVVDLANSYGGIISLMAFSSYQVDITIFGARNRHAQAALTSWF